jgi:REP element-mobilizing transposase RayT
MRKPRYLVPNAIYHVVCRANRQEMIFTDRFKKMYLAIIKEAKKKYTFNFFNFCIMDNHPHYDAEPLGDANLSRIVQWVNSVFAIRYNKIMKYKGHVFYDRFKSKVINSIQQYLRTIYYIASNPVRAGMVDHPLEYEFNSVTYRRRGLDPGLLDDMHPRIQKLVDTFLDNYPKEKYCRKIDRHSFFDRKPGRPRKKR